MIRGRARASRERPHVEIGPARFGLLIRGIAKASPARRSPSCSHRSAAIRSASRCRATGARDAARESPTCSCPARTPRTPRSTALNERATAGQDDHGRDRGGTPAQAPAPFQRPALRRRRPRRQPSATAGTSRPSRRCARARRSGSWPNSSRARRWRSRSQRRSSWTLMSPRRAARPVETAPPFSSSACSSATRRSICCVQLLVVHEPPLPIPDAEHPRAAAFLGTLQPRRTSPRRPGDRSRLLRRYASFGGPLPTLRGAGRRGRRRRSHVGGETWLTQRRTKTPGRRTNKAGARSWPTPSSRWAA